MAKHAQKSILKRPAAQTRKERREAQTQSMRSWTKRHPRLGAVDKAACEVMDNAASFAVLAQRGFIGTLPPHYFLSVSVGFITPEG